MLTSSDLLRDIELVLPPVPKPAGSALSFHPAGCGQCQELRQDMEQYGGDSIPDEGVRWLRGELSLLSAQGWRWALPSYLRLCLTQDTESDAGETEFLIYSLGPDQEFQSDAEKMLAHLSVSQLQLLERFLQWCSEHPYWSTYCPTDIAKAQAFIHQIVLRRGAA